MRERERHRNVLLLELRSGISQVELVEDTVAPVGCQGCPVLPTESLALGKETTQVSALSQFVAVEGFIDTIATHLVVFLSHRHHVDALARRQTDLPVVLWHTCDDVIVGEMPMLANVAIFNPDITVLLCERDLHHGILHEDRRMWLAVEMHDLTLVVHEILKSQRRRDHLP